MSGVDYQASHSLHQERHIRRRRFLIFALLLLGAVLAVAGVLSYDFLGGNSSPVGDKSRLGDNYQHQIGGANLITSSYFQFGSMASWSFAPNDSTSHKLTYLLYEAGVPAHSLTIYIDQMPTQDDLATTHLLPVRIANDNSLTVGQLSANCNGLYKASDPKVIRPVQLDGAGMLCVPDSPQYSAVVSQIGSDYSLRLKRQNGQLATYIIIYRNLSVNPDPTVFLRAMSSFKAL